MLRQGRLPEVRRHLAQSGRSTSDPGMRRARADLAWMERRFDDAAEHYRALLDSRGNPADAKALGRLLLQSERGEEAAAYYRDWCERWPGDPDFLCGMGDSLESVGDIEGAKSALRRAVTIDVDCGGAWYRLTILGDFDWLHDQHERLLTPAQANRDQLSRYMKEFAAGLYLENQERWEEAFERLTSGNELRRGAHQQDFRRKINAARLVMQDWRAQDWTRAMPGHESDAPIFVVGMPRSGTSLVEQILDSHPQVRGIGESAALQQETARTLMSSRKPIARLDWHAAASRYLDRVASIAGGSERFVDKMVFNFNTVGYIRRMFPNACIVHCRRDPIDTCVSCFRTCFDNRAMSYNLQELGWFFGYYEGLMDFWQEQYPNAVIEMEYEALVREPHREISRLLKSLDLPWSDRCLEFHENSRVVKTASIYQVRRPIYTTAVGRAKPYRRYLGPLLDGLEQAREWMRQDAA